MFGEVSIEDQAMNASNLTFGDDRLGVMFYVRVVEDHARSEAEGRKCFKEEEFIKIMIPGDRHNLVDRPVQVTGTIPTDDRLRFASHYARFKANKEQPINDGTPLALWPQIDSAFAEELKFINIHTVEQLATLADTYVGKIPGGQSWKAKAAAFVLALKDQEQVNKMMSELETRDNKIATLEAAIAEQAEQIAALIKKVK